jgi:hypothetical protein
MTSKVWAFAIDNAIYFFQSWYYFLPMLVHTQNGQYLKSGVMPAGEAKDRQNR